MKTFKEFSGLNEGTQAFIGVQDAKGKIKASILQYDGSLAKRDLTDLYSDMKKAKTLVTKTGELRSIYSGKPEYYNDKSKLETYKSEEDYIADVKGNSAYVYLFKDDNWFELNNRQFEII